MNKCSPYEFVDILLTEIVKVVEKCEIFQDKGFQRSLGTGHSTKKFAEVARICQILKIFPELPEGGC